MAGISGYSSIAIVQFMKVKIFSFFVVLTLTLGSGLQTYAQKHNKSLLSDTVDVVHYKLHLDLTSVAAQFISGSADIRLTTPLSNVTHIPLNLIQLQVDSVLSETGTHLNFAHTGNLLRIEAVAPFSVGDTLQLTVFYQGNPFHESWGGFHFYNPYAFNLGVGFQSIPHNLGKAWFPCVDDFIDRAFYDYHIRVINAHMAACGGLLQSVTDLNDGTREFHWKSDRSIPTYLASVASGPYAMLTDTFSGMEQQIPITWFVRPQDTSRVSGSFLNLNSITEIFETAFGPYPFQRIGFTGTALGAMEHAENISYPNGSINGSLSDEWLYAHELSHMWFGNMVTCASDGDMWLNEGWARWCETLYREHLYGIDAARSNMRSLSREVMRMAHITEGDYLPLSPMPQNLTYGTHVYDKGGMVTHGLRGYLGDSLFFDGVKAYLQAFAWQPASSYQMRDFLSQHTGVDLTGFFDFHVFGPGYNHVSVDSFSVTPVAGGFEVEVFVEQKLKGADYLAADCRTELAFMNASREIETRVITFSGKNGSAVFTLASEPILVMVDLFEKHNGAANSNFKTINTNGVYDFPDTYFKMEVTGIADSAFVQVAHNWVAPDSLTSPQYGLTLSNYRYWTVSGIFPEGFSATGRFSYSRGGSLDHTLLSSAADSLVILYRPDAAHNWQSVPFTRSGPWHIGTIFVPQMQPGEYTLAVWDEEVVSSGDKVFTGGSMIRISPNPARANTSVYFNAHGGGDLYLIDTTGKVVHQLHIPAGQAMIPLSLQKYTPGNYFLQFIDRKGRREVIKMIITQ